MFHPEWIPKLAETIRSGITTLEPHHRDGRDRNGLFNGSYDWHSCVLGYWSLVSMARLCDDEKMDHPTSLTSSNLLREIDSLKQHPKFELPYGRAWLLLLLEEIDRPELFAAKKWLLTDLYQWLETSDFPESPDEVCGTHQSWLMCFFLVLVAHRLSSEATTPLSQIWHRKAESSRPLIGSRPIDAHDSWNFIDPLALMSCIDVLLGNKVPKRQLAKMQTWLEELLARGLPQPSPQGAHFPGRIAMYGWAFALAGDSKNAWHAIETLLLNQEYWAQHFKWHSHWVPQYIWFAYMAFQERARLIS